MDLKTLFAFDDWFTLLVERLEKTVKSFQTKFQTGIFTLRKT